MSGPILPDAVPMNAGTPRFIAKRPKGHHNLHWASPSWFIMRALAKSLDKEVARLALPSAAVVLDYGCATQPYRRLFPDPVKYLGADLPGNEVAHVHINPDGSLPIDSNSIDVVLSTQVLEHVEEPAQYVAECFRVLRPGGHLILTTHGLWIYHRDPVDYWRWTGDGLQLQVERAGFAIDHMIGLMGLTGVSVQLFQDATLMHLPRFLRKPYAFVLQRLIAMLDRLHSTKSRRDNAMVYVLAARRPLN